MRKWLFTLLAASLLSSAAWAGEDPLAGNWRLMIVDGNNVASFWLINFSNKGGKWTGSAAALKDVPKTTIHDFKTDGDVFSFGVKLENGNSFTFEGKAPKAGAKKAFGSLSRGPDSAVPAWLEVTTATTRFELDKEFVARSPSDPRVFNSVLDLIASAKENKAATKEVQDWADTSLRSAELFGRRLQVQHAFRLLDVLQEQPDYVDVAVAVGRAANKLVEQGESLEDKLHLYGVMARALNNAKQKDEAAIIEAKADKLEGAAYAEHEKKPLGFDLITPKKVKNSRPVLVELFTGAQCPPCVAADLGFDGLAKTYPNSDVILLQYHMHVPRPDPLTSMDCEPRFEYYASSFRQVRGTPAIMFNGKPDALGGGGAEGASVKYKAYTEIIDTWMAKPTTVQMTGTATRKGDKIAMSVSLKASEKLGKGAVVRVVLVEDWVRYRGTNGLPFHHRVVRAMPSTPKGAPVTKVAEDFAFTADVEETRQQLNKYLDAVGKESEFPDRNRPMRMRSLRMVAFVQDDESAEVLQAIEVPVTEK